MINIKKYIPINTKRRSGIKLKGVKFIVAHDTGNPNSTANQNVQYFINSADEMSASAHVFIDDQNIIECVPLNEKAWHVRYNVLKDNELYGCDANDYAIGVELCFSPSGAFNSLVAYNNYVGYIRDLCKTYNLDPRKHIVGHYTLDPDRKTDPINAFKTFGKTWNQFIDDVAGAPVAEEMVNISVKKSKLNQILAYISLIN